MVDDLAWEGYVKLRRMFNLPVPEREALDEWDPPVHVNELIRWREFALSEMLIDSMDDTGPTRYIDG